jgi:hypothetical protein
MLSMNPANQYKGPSL